MRRALHFLLLLAILPGVIMPGATTLCLCHALACQDAGPCCEIASTEAGGGCHAANHAAPPCCRKHRPAGATIRSAKACHGCVVVVPQKQTSPVVKRLEAETPTLAPPITVAIATHDDDIAGGRAPCARPTSTAPPDRSRSLPLLI